MSRGKGKILVIRGGAIGDFVLTLPAIAALRQHFPAAHLEVLGYPHIVELAMAAGLVDRAQRIDAAPLAAFFARGGDLSEDMADYFSEFDLILSYLYDPDLIFQTNISRCSAAQFIRGPHRPEEAAGLPASLAFLKPLERLAIFDADPHPKLSLTPGSTWPNQLALHPGSGSELKNWPEDKWAHLLRMLVDCTPHNLLLVGGEAEGERLQRLAAALPPTRTRVAQSWPLVRLASVLQTSVAFVGHDSGISHIAAALGLPALILWGNSRESVWKPLNEKVRIARSGEGLSGLAPEDVFERLLSMMRDAGGPESTATP